LAKIGLVQSNANYWFYCCVSFKAIFYQNATNFFGVWHNVVRPFTDNFGMLKIVRTSIIARETAMFKSNIWLDYSKHPLSKNTHC
jgi:hypothetical protein